MKPPHEALFALVDAGVGMRPAARKLRMTPGAAAGLISRRRGYRAPSRAGADYDKLVAAYGPQISFRTDVDTLAQLNALAAKRGTTRTQLVRDLVEWALEEFS